tara:strand:- start:80 stop:577 length:498 start_codon:yes stop_codon:yes gene_type:complete
VAASNSKIEDQVRYEDGKLYWVKPRQRSLIGKECGYYDPSKKYRFMSCEGRVTRVHHVVWYLHKGAWPNPLLDMDHINMNKLDNRIENLRQVTRRVNNLNRKAANVSVNGKKWRAVVAHVHLGSFADRDEAVQVAQLYKKSIILNESSPKETTNEAAKEEETQTA